VRVKKIADEKEIQSDVYAENKTDSLLQNNETHFNESLNQNVYFNYMDVESTITKFSAASHENVLNWIIHFENMSKLFNTPDNQK